MPAPRPYARLAAVWTLVVVAVIAGAMADATLAVSYTGAQVNLRGWLSAINLVTAVSHTLVLSFALAVVAVMARRGAVGHIAITCWVLAWLTGVASIVAPLLLSPGPWPVDSGSVTLMTTLAFLPSVVRDVAFVSLFVRRDRNYFESVAVSLMLLSIALSLYRWFVTPVDVMMHIHVLGTAYLSLVPWLIASLLAVLSWSTVRELREY